jgi:hypothetical protein
MIATNVSELFCANEVVTNGEGRAIMAVYKYTQYVERSNDKSFDAGHKPGVPAPFAGIYRCMGCHREVGIADGHILPPQNHHTHTAQQGLIRWRLAVWADHNPKD